MRILHLLLSAFLTLCFADSDKIRQRYVPPLCFINQLCSSNHPKVLYTPSGEIRRVTLKPSERRTLGGAQYESEEEENIDKNGANDRSLYGLRRLYPCSDCEETWNVMCSEGLSSVCDLHGYGSPFSTGATDAIGHICSLLGGACSGVLSDEACRGQCVEGEDGDDDSDDDNEDDDYSGGAGVIVLTYNPRHRLKARKVDSRFEQPSQSGAHRVYAPSGVWSPPCPRVLSLYTGIHLYNPIDVQLEVIYYRESSPFPAMSQFVPVRADLEPFQLNDPSLQA